MTQPFRAVDVNPHLGARERLLLIPTQQRGLAEALGARLNQEGDWVVQPGARLDDFAPWISTHRASSFGVVVVKVWCGSCFQMTRIAHLLLSKCFEDMRRQVDGTPAWARNRHTTFVPRCMSYVSGNTLARLNAFNPNFRLVHTECWGDVYMNHCEHCGKQRHVNEVTVERYAAVEPGSITNILSYVEFDEPVYLHAGDGLEVWLNQGRYV